MNDSFAEAREELWRQEELKAQEQRDQIVMEQIANDYENYPD